MILPRVSKPYVASLRHPEAAEAGLPFHDEDLRDIDLANCVRNHLEAYPVDMIEHLLATPSQQP
jgi:hypothetical protein